MSKNMNKSIDPKYAYNYAEIDPATHMCIAVLTTTADSTGVYNYVPIPLYDENYLLKYYLCENHPEFTNQCLDGKWYEDPEGKIPWKSALLGK